MNPKPNRGFTLIELLVVIAIIAILAALIFPMVSKVRMSGFESKALGNIRQVGTGYLLVAQENNGNLPGWINKNASVPFDASRQWSRQVNKALSQSADASGDLLPVFKDPAAIARKMASPDSSLHFAPLAAITKYRIESDGTMVPAGPANLRNYRRLVQFDHLARQILLADSGTDEFGFGYGDLDGVDGGQSTWEAAVKGTPSSKGDTPIVPGDSGPGNIRWHDGAAKFFFLDGHVERRKQAEVLRYNVNPLYP